MTQSADTRATQVFYFDATCIEHADRIFAHCPTADYYSHRALLVADRADFVLLKSPAEPSYLDYLAGFGLGPDPAHVFVVNEDASEPEFRLNAGVDGALKDLASAMQARIPAGCLLVPYVHHQRIGELASVLADQSSVNVVYPLQSIDPAYRYSNLAECRKLAAKLELPLPKGILLEMDREMIALTVPRHFFFDQALVIKGLWGSSGSEVRKLAAGWNEGRLTDELSELDPDGPVIIEEAIEDHLATNVMLHIGDETDDIEVIGLTDQLIAEGTNHVGNAFPSRSRFQKEITAASVRIAEVLQIEGFRGFAGVDFMETLPGDGVASRYYFLEVNPRVNASLHPLAVMRKLNELQRREGNRAIHAFVQQSYPVKAGVFAEVRDLLKMEAFDPETGCGMVLYPPSFMNAGSLSVVLLGQDREDLDRLDEAVLSKLSAAGMART